MLGFLGRALLFAVGAAAVAAIVIYISGIITEEKLRERLKDEGIGNAIVKAKDNCNNVMTLEEFKSGRTIEVRGDGISDYIEENDVIYVY